MSTPVRDRDDALVEHLPQLLRLAAALTGSRAPAERLAAEALARVSPADLGSAYPLLPLRQAVVRRYLQRSFPAPSTGPLDALPKLSVAVLALSTVERLPLAELATTVERPAGQVQTDLQECRAALVAAGHDPDGELRARSEIEVDPVAVRRGADRARRRRRRMLRRNAVLALLAVSALALALVAPGVLRARWPVDPRPVDRWAQYVELEPVDGWRLTDRVVARTQESVTFSRQGNESCTLVVADGDELAAPQAGESAVRVNGRRGVLPNQYGGPVVRWAYTEGAVADLSCAVGQVDQDTLLTLAAAVRFRATPLLLPFRLPAAPDPFRPAWVTVEPGQPGVVAVSYSTADPRWSYVTVRVTTDHEAFTVPGSTDYPALPPTTTTTTVNGRSAYVRPDRDGTGLPEICLSEPTGRICLSAWWTSGDQTVRFLMTGDVGTLLLRTAEQLEPAADLDDSASWFDARDVLG